MKSYASNELDLTLQISESFVILKNNILSQVMFLIATLIKRLGLKDDSI